MYLPDETADGRASRTSRSASYSPTRELLGTWGLSAGGPSRGSGTCTPDDEGLDPAAAVAAAAWAAGKFDDELVPVSVKQKKGDPIVFAKDEGVRADATAESLGQLRAALAERMGPAFVAGAWEPFARAEKLAQVLKVFEKGRFSVVD